MTLGIERWDFKRILKWLLALIVAVAALLTVILAVDRDLNKQRAGAVIRELEIHFGMIRDGMQQNADALREVMTGILSDEERYKHTYIVFRSLSYEALRQVYGDAPAELDLWFEESGHPVIAYNNEYFISFHIELEGSVDVAYFFYSFIDEKPADGAIPLGDSWYLVYNRHW